MLLSRCSSRLGVLLTTVDPIKVTEYSVVFSAVALPLTYFPILVVANDPDYMGEHVNGRLANALGTVYLVVIVVAAARGDPAHDRHQDGGRDMDRLARQPSTPSCTCSTGRSSTRTAGWWARSTTSS